MRERVSTILADRSKRRKNFQHPELGSVILVAPHGADDTNTDILTEVTADILGCYAVINRGFERAQTVDVDKDLADCNRIDHCKEDVVYEEFLKPIKKFKDRIVGPYHTGLKAAHIFYIHGCGDIVHKEVGVRVRCIIGNGLGLKIHSRSCDDWRKNTFSYSMFMLNGPKEVPCLARGGSKYAGRDANNLNQYFRKHDINFLVQSMQLEFPYSARRDDQVEYTAHDLATVIVNYLIRAEDIEASDDKKLDLSYLEDHAIFI